MIPRLYCLFCTRTFLNAVSRITYITPDETGEMNEHLFHERGYTAIEAFAKLMDEAKAKGNVFVMNFNLNASQNMLYATVLVGGTGVCTAHLYDVDPYGGGAVSPQGLPSHRRSIR